MPLGAAGRGQTAAGWVAILGAVLLLAAGARADDAREPPVWSAPARISEEGTFNWFPDVAVDSLGVAHVVWDAALTSDGQVRSGLLHTQRASDAWTRPFEVVDQSDVVSNIYRAAIAADDRGDLFLWFYPAILRRIPAAPGGLSAPHAFRPNIFDVGAFYMGGLATEPGGTVHVLYDKLTSLQNPIRRGEGDVLEDLADIYYRRSRDRGGTWGPLRNLSETDIGETREKIEVDARGVVYVSWDEGWDRPTWYGRPERGVLRLSRDGGDTWSPKIVFAAPDGTNAQCTVAGDGRGGVLAVWRATTREEIFSAWSADDGATWSAPAAIPGVFARPWTDTPFDGYDLAADGAGVLHLAAVGRERLDQSPSHLYALRWDGRGWSVPQAVYDGAGWPEYPRLVSSQGNRLHLAWFVRDRLPTKDGRYQVFYAEATADAPAQPLPPALPLFGARAVANLVSAAVVGAGLLIVVRLRRRERASC